MDSRGGKQPAIAMWFCTVIAILAVVQYLHPPDRSLAWITVFDAGHAPLFGVIALAMRRLLLSARLRGPLLYGTALGSTILLGTLCELLQIGGSRNSDPWDLARDGIGATAFLLVAATRDPHAFRRASRRTRASCWGAALALLALAFIPGALVARAYAQRAAAFPALCDFAGTWERRFVTTNQARLDFTTLPGPENGRVPAGRITFEPARYTAFSLLEPYPDWTGYQLLRLVLYSELDRAVELNLRIHDRQHRAGYTDRFNRRVTGYTDRFNRRLTVRPGANEFVIPLADVRTAPETREMNMGAIARLNLFAQRPSESFSLYLLALRLD